MGQIRGTYLDGFKAVRLDTFQEYDKLFSADEDAGEIEILTPDGIRKVTCLAGFKLVRKGRVSRCPV